MRARVQAPRDQRGCGRQPDARERPGPSRQRQAERPARGPSAPAALDLNAGRAAPRARAGPTGVADGSDRSAAGAQAQYLRGGVGQAACVAPRSAGARRLPCGTRFRRSTRAADDATERPVTTSDPSRAAPVAHARMARRPQEQFGCVTRSRTRARRDRACAQVKRQSPGTVDAASTVRAVTSRIMVCAAPHAWSRGGRRIAPRES